MTTKLENNNLTLVFPQNYAILFGPMDVLLGKFEPILYTP